MVQLSATRCSCATILRVSIVSFATIILCVASQRVFIVVRICFVIDSVRKLLDTPSYMCRAYKTGGVGVGLYEAEKCGPLHETFLSTREELPPPLLPGVVQSCAISFSVDLLLVGP
jgi:hypothetical protein